MTEHPEQCRPITALQRFIAFVEADADREQRRADRLAAEMVTIDGLDASFLDLRHALGRSRNAPGPE